MPAWCAASACCRCSPACSASCCWSVRWRRPGREKAGRARSLILNRKFKLRSSPRMRGPRLCRKNWVPASAGTNGDSSTSNPRSGLTCALFAVTEYLVGGGDHTVARILGAVLAELLAVLAHLVEIDDRRRVILAVVSVEPHQHQRQILLVVFEELFAGEGRKIKLLLLRLRRKRSAGRGSDRQHQ